jgi:cytochrome c peroxidase
MRLQPGKHGSRRPAWSRRRSSRPHRLAALLIVSGLALAGCGGGSGGASGAVSSPPPLPVSNTPPPPANQSPVLVHAPAGQNGVTNHTFSFDLSQGGTTVTDPDGDALTYKVLDLGVSARLPAGLVANGPLISGVPTEACNCQLQIQVDDGRGGNSVSFLFDLQIVANSPPTVANGNQPRLVVAGQQVDVDAAQGGTTFRDANGDPLSYTVTLRGNPHGLSVAGTHVRGTFDAIGAVEVTITATDGFGGTGIDAFLIAAPTAVPTSAPNLPTTPYLYKDEELPLPYVFALSSQIGPPLWDTQPADNRTTDAGAALGRVLFYDPRLSITNTHSCSSCHQQALGFSSSNRFDTGILGIPLPRKSMPLANVRYNINVAWFSDMRVTGDLRNVIFVPIDNHNELGMALFPVETKLAGADFYPPLFAAAFGTPEITRERIAAALAQFVQSLISYRSKWDLANNSMTNGPGDPKAVLTAQELQGMQTYLTRCQTCHEQVANTNVWQANNGLDVVPTDPGTTNPAFQRNGSIGVFRAAALRNIAVSGPYMHDGRFATLAEVIEHYNSGIQDSPNLDPGLRDLTGATWRLNLSDSDKLALEAFLNTFTDTAFLTDPKFSDPFAH